MQGLCRRDRAFLTLQLPFADLQSLKEEGTTIPQLDQMLDFESQNAVVGLPEMLAKARRYQNTR